MRPPVSPPDRLTLTHLERAPLRCAQQHWSLALKFCSRQRQDSVKPEPWSRNQLARRRVRVSHPTLPNGSHPVCKRTLGPSDVQVRYRFPARPPPGTRLPTKLIRRSAPPPGEPVMGSFAARYTI